jgi:hypothetical protein
MEKLIPHRIKKKIFAKHLSKNLIIKILVKEEKDYLNHLKTSKTNSNPSHQQEHPPSNLNHQTSHLYPNIP